VNGLDREDKPAILPVIEERVQLRRSGGELIGECPFHADSTPSLSVNVEKQLFHCFGCGEGGDVFDFIMRFEGCTFAEAARSLGVATDKPRKPYRPSKEGIAITEWANSYFWRAQSFLREINRRVRLAQELSWREEIDRLVREFQILSVLSDDLQTPRYALALYRDAQAKSWVENLLADTAPQEPPEFPELTAVYRERLRAYSKG
jgi:hypothetical protein